MSTRRITKEIAIVVILLFIVQVFTPILSIASTTEGITSEIYKEESGVIKRVSTGTTVKMFLENITVDSGASKEVYNGETKVTDDTTKITSGMKLKVGGNATYNIAVRGDANGDGKLTATDLSLYKMHFVNLKKLESPYEQAIDVNYDNHTTSLDGSQLKMLLVSLALPGEEVATIAGEIKIIPDTTSYVRELGITIEWPNDTPSGAIKQVSLDGGQTYQTYANKATMKTSDIVVARLMDANGNVLKSATLTITNVDDEGPEAFELDYTHTIANYVLMNGETIDKKSGMAEKPYQFSYDDGETWLPQGGQKEGTYTLMTVPANSRVNLKMKASDRLGNETETPAKEQRTFTKGIELLKDKLSGATVDEENDTITLINGDVYKLAVTLDGSYSIYPLSVGGQDPVDPNELDEINKAIADFEVNGAKTIEEILGHVASKGLGTAVFDAEQIEVEKEKSYIRYRIIEIEEGKHKAAFFCTIIKNGQTISGQNAEEELINEIDAILAQKTASSTVIEILTELINQGLLLEENVNMGMGTFETEVGTTYRIIYSETTKTYEYEELCLAEEFLNNIIEAKLKEMLEIALKNEMIDWAIEDEITTEDLVNREDGTFTTVDGKYNQTKIDWATGTHTILKFDEKPAGPAVKVTVVPEFPVITDQVTINVKASDSEGTGGISKIELFTEVGDCIYTEIYDPAVQTVEYDEIKLTNNGVYRVVVTDSNGNKTTKEVIIANVSTYLPIKVIIEPERSRNTVKTGKQNGIEAGPITVTLDYDKAATLTNTDKYQYKFAKDNEWKTASKKQEITGIEENCVIYARYYNGENGIKQIRIDVDNVDNVSPNDFEFTTIVTSSTITVEAKATDSATDSATPPNSARDGVAGIAKYLYEIDGNGKWQTDNILSGLTQGSTHKVSVKAVDFAGNEKLASNSGISNVKLANVPDAKDVITVMGVTPEVTKGPITVNFEGDIPDGGYTVQYQIVPAGSTPSENGWKYGDSAMVSENCDIYVRLIDPTGQTGGTSKTQIRNIDSLSPNAFTPTKGTVTENSITVSVNVTDAAATSTSASSGIKGYEYYIVSDYSDLKSAKDIMSNTYTFNDLEPGTVHTIEVIAIDKAGNRRTSEPISVTTTGEEPPRPGKEWVLGVGNFNEGPGNVPVNNGKASYKNPVVPVGFKAVEQTGATWAGAGQANGYDKGLVIEDTNGNQFVWVPVNNGTIKYEKLAGQTNKDDSNKTAIEKKQIELYGGFYISRYEAGNDGGILASKAKLQPVNSVTYLEAKGYADTMYNNPWAKSGLLTGTAWDTTTKWIAEEKGMGYVTNNITTGNNRVLGGYTFSGIHAKGPNSTAETRGEWTTGTNVTKTADESFLLGTGLNEAFKAKNIYDLAGNVWEYTYEQAETGDYIARGGDYYNEDTKDFGIAKRETIVYPENRNEGGFRVMLYLIEEPVELGTYDSHNRSMNGKPANFNNPVIPAGYAPVDKGASWGNGTTAPDYDNGVVIQDAEGNEFVWVPVNNTTVKYEKWITRGETYIGSTDDSLPTKVTGWGHTEKTQVSKYGGFYIARYETGKGEANQAVSKAGVNAWTNITYAEAKTAAEALKTTKGAAGGLVTGTQWDTIMRWIANQPSIGEAGVLQNSKSWGDYSDSTLGANAKAKQIYRLAGGAWEWTTEKNATGQAYRGGVKQDSGSSSPAGYRGFKNGTTIDQGTTMRMVLYITGEVAEAEKKAVETKEATKGTDFIKTINTPVLTDGLIPVKWAGNSWVPTTANDSNWYDYADTSITGENTSKWTNAKTPDGSMFVWIPRFAYKINSSNQTIDVIFLAGATDKPVAGGMLPPGYKVHPAFTNNPDKGGWDEELTGFWVGKFNAGESGSTKQGVAFYKNMTGGNSFEMSQNAELGYTTEQKENVNTHMLKNTEYGAVTYLAHSKYGVNGAKIEPIKNVNIAGEDFATYTSPSSTGNATGVYDLVGISGTKVSLTKQELIAGYIKDIEAKEREYTDKSDGTGERGYTNDNGEWIAYTPAKTTIDKNGRIHYYAKTGANTYIEIFVVYVAEFYQTALRYQNISDMVVSAAKYKNAYSAGFKDFYGDAMWETAKWQGANWGTGIFGGHGRRPQLGRGAVHTKGVPEYDNIFSMNTQCANSQYGNAYRIVMIAK